MERWPDPTGREARALILGPAVFWAGTALSVPLFTGGSAVGVVPFLVGFAAGMWSYYGGMLHVVARAHGTTVGRLQFQSPRRALKDRRTRGSWRILLPSYTRRAARILGWNEHLVLTSHAVLLAAGVAGVFWINTHAPPPAR